MSLGAKASISSSDFNREVDELDRSRDPEDARSTAVSRIAT